MAKGILGTIIVLLVTQAQALELACEGWYQELGGKLQQVKMTKGEQTNLNWKQSAEVNGYKYDVDWDVNLDSIYTTITQNGNRVLFTTARVPTFPHNDSFTDMNLPNGPRVAVSCNFK